MTVIATGRVVHVDLSHLLATDPADQGDRPTCLAVAVSFAHQLARSSLPDSQPLAPEALWSHAHSAGEAGPSGTNSAAIGRALSGQGQGPLSLWPYNSALGDETEAAPAGAAAGAWWTARLTESALKRDGREEEIVAELELGHVVVVGIAVTDEFAFVSGTDIVPVPVAMRPDGWHAVCVVGYATDPGGVRLFRIRNSWGDDWADSGYTWLPSEYLREGSCFAAVIR